MNFSPFNSKRPNFKPGALATVAQVNIPCSRWVCTGIVRSAIVTEDRKKVRKPTRRAASKNGAQLAPA